MVTRSRRCSPPLICLGYTEAVVPDDRTLVGLVVLSSRSTPNLHPTKRLLQQISHLLYLRFAGPLEVLR